jgi:hypothetical protein
LRAVIAEHERRLNTLIDAIECQEAVTSAENVAKLPTVSAAQRKFKGFDSSLQTKKK